MKPDAIYIRESDDKPGYVVDDHLSRPIVTNRFQQPTRKHSGQLYCFLFGLASSGVYRALPVTSQAVSSYLAFPPLPGYSSWRFISVALVWESPPPDVIRHPALWSPDFPHLRPFGTCSRDHLSDSIRNFSIWNFLCKGRNWRTILKPQDVVVPFIYVNGNLNKICFYFCLKKRKTYFLLDLLSNSEYNGNTDVTIM